MKGITYEFITASGAISGGNFSEPIFTWLVLPYSNTFFLSETQ